MGWRSEPAGEPDESKLARYVARVADACGVVCAWRLSLYECVTDVGVRGQQGVR